MQKQSTFINDAIESDGPTWVLVTDAGRFDIFDELCGDYVPGSVTAVDNGGALDTPGWFREHFPGQYHAMLFHGGQPIKSIDGRYVERDHFRHVPYTTLYDSNENDTSPPASVNGVVRNHLPHKLQVAERLHALGYRPRRLTGEFDFHVVRYLQPHKPYRRDDGDLWERYRDNYRWVLDAVSSLAPELPGDVYITADHGECLGDCGQRWHGRGHEPHEHLTTVPWLHYGQ